MNPAPGFSLLLNIVGFSSLAVGLALQFGPIALLGFGVVVLGIDAAIDALTIRHRDRPPLPSTPPQKHE